MPNRRLTAGDVVRGLVRWLLLSRRWQPIWYGRGAGWRGSTPRSFIHSEARRRSARKGVETRKRNASCQTRAN